MKNEDIFSCYLNPLTNEEASLISNFWLLSEDQSAYAYKYRLAELSEKFGLDEDEILKLIKENCFVTTRSEWLNCESCGCKLKTTTRTNLIELRRKNKTKFCDDCREAENKRVEEEHNKIVEEINKIAEQKVGKLTSSPVKLNLPIFEKNKLINLSYTEKLTILSLMLDAKVLKNRPLQLSKEELNLSGDTDGDVIMLQNLLSKGAIYVLENTDKLAGKLLADTDSFISQNRRVLNPMVIDKYSRFLASQPQPGIYILVPSCFETMEDYKSWLFDEVINTKVGDTEVKEIEELVIANRLSQAYLLACHVKNTYKIPIQFKIKLESVLISLVRQYSLPKAFGIMKYQAKQVAAKLYSNPEMPFFYQDKLFAKHIETYLSYLRENEKSPYWNSLPDFIYGSKIEHFSSYYLMGELTGWDDLSANEIIARWIQCSAKVKLAT